MLCSKRLDAVAETVFEAKNDLEHHLLALHAGRMTEAAFLDALILSEVFMPIRDEEKHQIQGFQRSTHAVPLTLEADDGTLVMLVFTSPERAKPVVREFADFGGGLLTEFPWVLKRLEAGCGISLNLGWEIGFDMEPALVDRLRAQLVS